LSQTNRHALASSTALAYRTVAFSTNRDTGWRLVSSLAVTAALLPISDHDMRRFHVRLCC
jgi:hypothetical protein